MASGPAELDSALRSGRALVALAPLRESGYRLLMEALAARGDTAEALVVYDLLRCGCAMNWESLRALRRKLSTDVCSP
jgi:two-component SAPR family response regulator